MKTYVIAIQGLDCPECAKVIETDLNSLPGVENTKLDFTRGIVTVTGETDLETLRARIRRLGFVPVAEDERKTTATLDFKGFWDSYRRNPELKITFPGFILLGLSLFLEGWGVPRVWVLLIQLVSLAVAGFPVFRGGYFSLFIEHSININFLMSIAVIGAVFIGETQEALILLVLFSFSEALEDYTNDHARAVLSEFADLAPKQALLLTEDGEKTISVEHLAIGDLILIKAGERFPMDGMIVEGSSDVNQAPITGESKLVNKKEGDQVLSGTINGQGLLKVRITHLAADTTMQRIITLVTEAQATKAKQEKFIDRFAKVYTPIVVGIAVLVAVIPTVFLGQPLLNSGESYGWLHRALSLLMIGCPCALVISTPITIISALTRAARSGVVFKGGVYLESLSQIKLIAFDKTGTLTRGKPGITTVRAVDCEGSDTCEPCNDLLALACSLEQHSSHPLSIAVLEEGEQRGVLNRYPPAEAMKTINGKGQQGWVNGKLATVGSLGLFEAEHNTPPDLVSQTKAAETQGQTTMLVCDGERVRGFLGVEDEIRPGAKLVLDKLRKMGWHIAMLTGDNQTVAEKVGEQLGVDEVFAGLLPEEKLTTLSNLREKYGQVIMVGDGINDSPALAQADIGIAMGGAGNAQVLETADIVLMNDDLSQLPFAVQLSQFTNRLIRRNIIFSLGIKFLVAILAMLGLTPLWVAVLADIGVTLLVTLNGMRAMHFGEGEPAIIG
ncbi:MAG: cation-translocating P-type ATPase [Anaerolineaceae bacterium]